MPQPTERTLAVIGSTSVGKSALTLRFVRNEFPENYDPTIAKSLIKRFTNKSNGHEYNLTVYDTAGLDEQGQIPQQYIDSHGFILVYSIADKHSFDIIKEIYYKLLEEKNTPNIHAVLIGNKTDLNERRRVSFEAGSDLVREWKSLGSMASFIETSARTGEKVEEVFITLLNSIDSRTNTANGHLDNGVSRPQQQPDNSNPKNKQCTIC